MNTGFFNDHLVYSSWNNLDNITQIQSNTKELNQIEINEIQLKEFWDNLTVTTKLSVGTKTYNVNVNIG